MKYKVGDYVVYENELFVIQGRWHLLYYITLANGDAWDAFVEPEDISHAPIAYQLLRRI